MKLIRTVFVPAHYTHARNLVKAQVRAYTDRETRSLRVVYDDTVSDTMNHINAATALFNRLKVDKLVDEGISLGQCQKTQFPADPKKRIFKLVKL